MMNEPFNFPNENPDKNLMLTAEGRAQLLQRINSCNALAYEIFGRMLDRRRILQKDGTSETSEFYLTKEDVEEIFRQHNIRIADWRLAEVGRDLARALTQYGAEPCGVIWFAHMLEHDIYDPNLQRTKS